MTDIVLEKADTLAAAIPKAEGFNVPGSLPQRIHNPGDMELGDRGWGLEQGKTVYLKADFAADLHDKTDGASALRRECFAILSGCSLAFCPDWTFAMLAMKWTGNDNPEAWCKIVCDELGVTPETKMSAWVLDKEEA